MTKTLFFDLSCGASGDMILASLIDLGFPLDILNQKLSGLNIESINIDAKRTVRNGISCTHIDPQFQHSHTHRHQHDILEIIKKGGFSESVYKRCELVLDRLADAESKVHGIAKEKVHFHEIGAVDTIIDILGVCLGLEYLGVENIGFSALTVGHGTINIAHGTIPVPVPATLNMIQGFNIKRLDIPTEILTPTGAAILTALGKQEMNLPEGKLLGSGYGCGTKVFDNYPNLIRAFLLEDDSPGFSTDTVYIIETDMDHITGEIMGNVGQKLMENGALDLCWVPIYMKKGRPGYRLTVICSPSEYQSLADLIIIHTRTLGVRIQKVDRVIAARQNKQIQFLGHDATEKHCFYKGHSFSKLEYESLNEISRIEGIPVIELMERYVVGERIQSSGVISRESELGDKK